MMTRLPILFILVAVSGMASWSQPAAASDLYLASWQAGFRGHQAAGSIAWIADREGSLRVEISWRRAAGGAPPVDGDVTALSALLRQVGDGWTVVLGPRDEGTVQPWGREWRHATPALAALVRAVVAARDPGCGRTGMARLVLDGPLLEGDGADPMSSWRRQMVARGRGRGATGEILHLEGAGAPDRWLTVRSSRRPGRLRIAPPSSRAAAEPVPEVFLPLWPLADLLEFLPAEPGTSSRGDG